MAVLACSWCVSFHSVTTLPRAPYAIIASSSETHRAEDLSAFVANLRNVAAVLFKQCVTLLSGQTHELSSSKFALCRAAVWNGTITVRVWLLCTRASRESNKRDSCPPCARYPSTGDTVDITDRVSSLLSVSALFKRGTGACPENPAYRPVRQLLTFPATCRMMISCGCYWSKTIPA